MRLRIIIVLTGCALALAACGGSAKPPGGPIDVVASTNVYGNIVSQIGASDVNVTSILTDPNADPHLFEASTSTGLAVAKAALVIENGLVYDSFMDTLLASTRTKAKVVTIANALPFDHGNPHLWYDIDHVPTIATAIEHGLEQADPGRAAAYRQGLQRFLGTLAPLRAELRRIERFAKSPVAYTEPVPGYLVDDAGLRNLAPEAFTRAIEDGSDPAPAAVAAMDVLIAKHRIRVLLYNSQAVTSLTKRLRAAALAAGVGVVPVTETLPPGLTYQQWQLGQMRALAAALAR